MGYSFEKESFFEANTRGELEVIELFLEAGMTPNVKTRDGRTPLHFAAKAGRPEVVKTLLNGGANPDARFEELEVRNEESTFTTAEEFAYEANTALMYAALRGDTETVKILLDNGSDPNVRTKNGYTALVLVAAVSLDTRDREPQTEMMKILLRNGANPNVKAEGYVPLIMAAKG